MGGGGTVKTRHVVVPSSFPYRVVATAATGATEAPPFVRLNLVVGTTLGDTGVGIGQLQFGRTSVSAMEVLYVEEPACGIQVNVLTTSIAVGQRG